MAFITSQGPGYEGHFQLSSSDRTRFDLARSVHEDYELVNEVSMGCLDDLCYLSQQRLGTSVVSVISAAPYDRSALTYCLDAFESLVGVRKSDILLIVEHPLAIIPEDCQCAFPDRIARAIGTDSGLRVVDPQSSLSSTEIIDRAVQAAVEQGHSADTLLGFVVNSVALTLNISWALNVAQGINTVAKVLGTPNNLLERYQDANRIFSYSTTQLAELRMKIDQAIVSAGLATDTTEAQNVHLYNRGNLLAVLSEIPERGGDILGFLACWAAPPQVSPCTTRALPACYEAWGGKFSAAQLHQGALCMGEHITNGPSGSTWRSTSLIRDIKAIIDKVRTEAVHRCVDRVISHSQTPSHILILADPVTALDFSSSIANKFR